MFGLQKQENPYQSTVFARNEAISTPFLGNTMQDLANADYVIVSVPVDVALQVLPEVLNHIGENTIVLKWVLPNCLFVRR